MQLVLKVAQQPSKQSDHVFFRLYINKYKYRMMIVKSKQINRNGRKFSYDCTEYRVDVSVVLNMYVWESRNAGRFSLNYER